MKTTSTMSDAQGLTAPIQLARRRVATAERRWKFAKRQRKAAKILARRAKKRAKQAKAVLAECRKALAKAEAEAKSAVTSILPAPKKKTAPVRKRKTVSSPHGADEPVTPAALPESDPLPVPELTTPGSPTTNQ